VAELAPYVSCVWVQEVAPDSPPYAFQAVPNGSVEVVCILGGLPFVIGVQMFDPANAVRTLTAELHISDSQLRRRFRTAVGCPPKVLHRTLRFWGFLALAQSGPQRRGSLTALAGSAGYADQAHLTRESVAITGVTPSELPAGRTTASRVVRDAVAAWRSRTSSVRFRPLDRPAEDIDYQYIDYR
jgi:AraC-like DNA-binding protein